MAGTATTNEVGDPVWNQTWNQPNPPRFFPSNEFKARGFTFEVVEWPNYHTCFVGVNGKLHPVGNYKAIYEAKGLSVVVWTSLATPQDGATSSQTPLYNIQLINEPLSREKNISASAVVNSFFKNQGVIGGSTRLSGPEYMCLSDGKNTTNHKLLQDHFASLKAGRVMRTTDESAGSVDAVREAVRNASAYIDRLPEPFRYDAVTQLIKKYGGGTQAKRDHQVNFTNALSTFTNLDLTKRHYLPYARTLQSILTVAAMGGAEKKTVSAALDIRFDGRFSQWEDAVERANKNMAEAEEETTVETTTEDDDITYLIHPKNHVFYGKRNMRKDAHESMGLAQEYRDAWIHEDYVHQVYAGKQYPVGYVQYELQTSS